MKLWSKKFCPILIAIAPLLLHLSESVLIMLFMVLKVCKALIGLFKVFSGFIWNSSFGVAPSHCTQSILLLPFAMYLYWLPFTVYVILALRPLPCKWLLPFAVYFILATLYRIFDTGYPLPYIWYWLPFTVCLILATTFSVYFHASDALPFSCDV